MSDSVQPPYTAAHQAPPSLGFSRQEHYLSIKIGDGFERLWNLDFGEYYECLLKFGTKDLLEGNDNYAPYIFVGFFWSGNEISDLQIVLI